MVSGLIKRLRTCSTEERRILAIELAYTGTDKAVKELTRMTEGRRRNWLAWYTPNEQIIGIESLGETKRQDVLKYLQRTYTHKWQPSECVDYVCGAFSTSGEEYTFPFASGKLGRQLFYSRETSPSYEKSPCNYNKSLHAIIDKSIQKLKDALKKFLPSS